MAKKSRSCPEFIQKMDWPVIILVLFLVSFLGSLTYNHYFTQQQQLRWQEIEKLQTIELAKTANLEITEELLFKADLNADGQIDQADIEMMKDAFLDIDSDSLQADLNQDGRVDTKDYTVLAHIISLQDEAPNDQQHNLPQVNGLSNVNEFGND